MSRLLLSVLLILPLSGPTRAGAAPVLDLTILMDASGSVGSSGFGLERDFVIDVLTFFAPQDGSVAASVIRFASVVTTIFDLTPITTGNVNQIKNDINGISYTKGFTHTKDALQRAIDQFANFGTPGADRFVLLITDGLPVPNSGSNSQNPCPLAPALRSAGIHVAIVAVGVNWDPTVIDCLVDDAATDIYSASSFGALDAQLISGVIFSAIPEPSILLIVTIGLAGLGRRARAMRRSRRVLSEAGGRRFGS